MNSRTELNKDRQKELEQQEKNEKIRKMVKKIVKAIVIIFLIVFIACLYVIKIGTVSLLVKEKVIINQKLSDTLSGIKIIQFTDLHYDNNTLLKDTVKTINKRNPDLILFTGDLLKDNFDPSTREREKLVTELKKLTATLGKYAVLGENDNDDAISILIDCGFTVLDNTNEFIYKDSNNPIMLVGINTNNKDLDLTKAFANYNENTYTILLLHNPEFIDKIISNYKPDLALAGHTHLGEVKIPYISSQLFKKDYTYTSDYYELDNTKLYISSGIGTTKYDVRFNARASINFFRIRKTA